MGRPLGPGETHGMGAPCWGSGPLLSEQGLRKSEDSGHSGDEVLALEVVVVAQTKECWRERQTETRSGCSGLTGFQTAADRSELLS